MALGGLLLVMILRERSDQRYAGIAVGVLLLGMLLGGLTGSWEGEITVLHFSSLAVTNTLILLLLLGVLVVALVRNAMDWHLWLALVIFALSQAFNVIWFAALAWMQVPAAWHPSPLQVRFYILAFGTGMLALAIRRLILTHRGVYVPAILESGPPPNYSTFG